MSRIVSLFLLLLALTACAPAGTVTANDTDAGQGTAAASDTEAGQGCALRKDDYLIWLQDQRLELIDPLENSAIAFYDGIEEDEALFSSYLWQDGYAVLLLGSGEEEPLRLLLLDEALTLVQAYDMNTLLGEDAQLLLISSQTSVLSEDGGTFVYITPLGMFQCSLSDGACTEVALEESLGLSSIVALGGGVAYAASVLDQDAMELGVLNWETGQVLQRQMVSGYSGWQCAVSDCAVWWNDSIDGYTDHSSGLVPIYDRESGSFLVRSVQDKESAFSCVSPDGESLFAVNFASENASQQLNCYRVATGEVLWTRELSLGDAVHLRSLRCSSQGDVLFLICADNSDGQESRYRVISVALEGL